MYIPRLPAGPRVASLASMAQASTLKKCKAADQSGLKRQRTQRPQCESLSLFFFLLQQSPLLALLSCSQQAAVEDTGVRSHLTESRTASTCPGALWECNKLSVDLRLHSAGWMTCLSLSMQGCAEHCGFTDVWTDNKTSLFLLYLPVSLLTKYTELLVQCLMFRVY